MRKITQKELAGILERHKEFLEGEEGGQRADLRWAKLRGADLRGADLRRANLTGANLREADLREADLRGAKLRGADLREADLREADLSEAKMSGADLRGAIGLPEAQAIANIDSKILAAIGPDGEHLDMGLWHTCDTTHCRAGWAINLAGERGRELEKLYGPNVAGALIYTASRPNMPVPDWHASNENALADIKACAMMEDSK